MTPEQRLDRAEKILLRMVKSGRRTRSEWRYKINSLIDAQIRHEAVWYMQHEAINEQLKEVAVAQAQNEKTIAELAKSTEKSIGELAESQRLNEKSIGELTELQKLNEKSIGELTESQKLTDKALRAFIDSLRKGRNGNSSD